VWNPELSSSKRIRLEAPFTFNADLSIEPRGVSIGPIHHRIVSLKSLPEQSFPTAAEVLSDLPAGATAYFSFECEDPFKSKERMERDRRVAFSMSAGGNRPRDVESETKLQELDQILELLAQGLERIIKLSLSIVVKDQSPIKVDQKVGEVISTIRKVWGADALI
jgi:hypothetical protein